MNHQIFVKNINGKTIIINASPNENICNVKLIISEKCGIPNKYYRLVYHGKNIDGTKTLSDYNIQKEDTLHMYLQNDVAYVFTECETD